MAERRVAESEVRMLSDAKLWRKGDIYETIGVKGKTLQLRRCTRWGKEGILSLNLIEEGRSWEFVDPESRQKPTVSLTPRKELKEKEKSPEIVQHKEDVHLHEAEEKPKVEETEVKLEVDEVGAEAEEKLEVDEADAQACCSVHCLLVGDVCCFGAREE